MKTRTKIVIDEVAQVLANALSDDTIARVMNDLVGCEAVPTLTDPDVEIGNRLFDALTALRPELVERAQNI